MYLVLAASMLNPLIYVELGRVPSALPPVFTASCGLSESRNVKSWSETQSDLIPSSLRPSSLNTLRPCAAEVSYLFFLSCWARLHTARTRGSHAFQQWCIMDHRRRRERADCRMEGVTPPIPPLSVSFSHFSSFLPPPPPSLTLFENFAYRGLRLGLRVMPFDLLLLHWAHIKSKCSCLN